MKSNISWIRFRESCLNKTARVIPLKKIKINESYRNFTRSREKYMFILPRTIFKIRQLQASRIHINLKLKIFVNKKYQVATIFAFWLLIIIVTLVSLLIHFDSTIGWIKCGPRFKIHLFYNTSLRHVCRLYLISVQLCKYTQLFQNPN